MCLCCVAGEIGRSKPTRRVKLCPDPSRQAPNTIGGEASLPRGSPCSGCARVQPDLTASVAVAAGAIIPPLSLVGNLGAVCPVQGCWLGQSLLSPQTLDCISATGREVGWVPAQSFPGLLTVQTGRASDSDTDRQTWKVLVKRLFDLSPSTPPSAPTAPLKQNSVLGTLHLYEGS